MYSHPVHWILSFLLSDTALHVVSFFLWYWPSLCGLTAFHVFTSTHYETLIFISIDFFRFSKDFYNDQHNLSLPLSLSQCYVAECKLRVLLFRSSPIALKALPTSLEVLASALWPSPARLGLRTSQASPFCEFLVSSRDKRLRLLRLKRKDPRRMAVESLDVTRLKSLKPIKPVNVISTRISQTGNSLDTFHAKILLVKNQLNLFNSSEFLAHQLNVPRKYWKGRNKLEEDNSLGFMKTRERETENQWSPHLGLL